MDFVASLVIPQQLPFEELVERVGELLRVRFIKDDSGRFEEFPAYVASVLGLEVAVLGIPAEEDLDEMDPVTEYGLLVRSVVEADDDSIETDLSCHLHFILRAGGIECTIGNP